MPSSIITIPTSTPSDLLAYLGAITTDLWPVLLLVLGIPFGIWVLSMVISFFRRQTRVGGRK